MMTKGKVKWYDEVKGYGFIETENGENIFVHRSGLYSAFSGLQTNQQVVFETKMGNKGLIAFNVQSEI